MPNNHHIEDSLDRAVGVIVSKPLSLGLVSETRRDRFVADRYTALAQGRMSFIAGMDNTIRALFYADTPDNLDSWQAHLATSGRMRVSNSTLEAWRLGLKHVPASVSEEGLAEFDRGRLHGALALSGLQDDYDTSNPVKRAPLTEENGFTAAYDEETGSLKSHIRLVNALPEDHPSGTPALITYWPNGKVKRETHYRNGKLHDGSGDTPTAVWNLANQHNDGKSRSRDQEWHANSGIRIERSVPNPNRRWGGDRDQDSPDGQPATEWQHADGSSSIQYATGGSRQDPGPGRHAMINTSPNGDVVRHHMLDGGQHDPDDDTPAVTEHRADGTLAKTVRYFNGTAWDGRNGEPAVIKYALDGSIEKRVHAGVIYPETGYPYYPTSETGPIDRAEKRGNRPARQPAVRTEPVAL